MRVHVVVPGWGLHHVDHKREILFRNLTVLNRTKGEHQLAVTLLTAGTDPVLVDRLMTDKLEMTVMYVAGTIGQHLISYITPGSVEQKADFVFILRDDAELSQHDPDGYNLSRAVELLGAAQLDILSPAMSRKSVKTHDYWLQRVKPQQAQPQTVLVMHEEKQYPSQQQQVIRHMHQLDMFCYLMSVHSYEIYMSLTGPETRSLFGLDMLLHVEGLRLGIWDNATFTHHYDAFHDWQTDSPHDPWTELETLCKRRGKVCDFDTTTLNITQHTLT